MSYNDTYKRECLIALRQLIERTPDFQAPRPPSTRMTTVARMCRICDVHKVRMGKVMLNAPALVVVLAGQKTVASQDGQVIASEGDFLLLPSGVEMDMLNEPGGTNGMFRSMVVEFEPHALRKFAGLYPNMVDNLGWEAGDGMTVFSPDAREGEALVHLGKALARGEENSPVLELRMFELMLALLLADHGRILFSLIGDDVPEVAQRLVALHPARQWTAPGVASQLGVSVSTLSRKLRQEGEGFRQLLRRVRMERAKELLQNEAMTMTDCAQACGYASLPKFRTRFKEHFGVSPARAQA